jgi:hypothetical protein
VKVVHDKERNTKQKNKTITKKNPRKNNRVTIQSEITTTINIMDILF